jgi:hypothetical protein
VKLTPQKFTRLMGIAHDIGGHYGGAYERGLRRLFQGEAFRTAREHEEWMALGTKEGDDPRLVEAGRGYRDGFAGRSPTEDGAATPEQCKELREGAGLSQQDMADLARLGSRSRWNEYESGVRTIDAARWQLVRAKVLLLQGNRDAALDVLGERMPSFPPKPQRNTEARPRAIRPRQREAGGHQAPAAAASRDT